MKTERFLKYGFAGLVWAAMWLLPVGCTIEEGEVPPRPTKVQYDIYWQVMRLNKASMEILYLVAGANEYLLQTTDEGREAVRLRFFPRAEFVGWEGGNWMLTNHNVCYLIKIKNDIPLGALGAVWTVYYMKENWPGFLEKGTFTTEGEALRCLIQTNDDPDQVGVVNWLAEIGVTETDFRVNCLSGQGTVWLMTYLVGEWDIDYRIEEPLVWSDAQQMARGLISVTARLQDNSGLELQFEARTTAPGEVTISCDGVSEKWD